MSAASSEVQQSCEEQGYWQTLLNAGAIPLPPGCGTCIGLGTGLLKAGEVGISATNRNFKGRMGHPDALAFLASPAVVVASAIAGKINYNWIGESLPLKAECATPKQTVKHKPRTDIINGFAPYASGKVIFCPKDNINTDGIFPGKYTYIDDFTPEQQAGVVMENYDPDFKNMARQGDILVGGFNFGTGSSREQAATALKYKGIQLVIAGSFNETYKRNALNNGFLVVDSPQFTKWLKAKYPGDALTVRTDISIEIDFHESMIWVEGLEFQFGSIGTAAQELIVSGGLENWIKQSIC
jgi:homoaconitate hydratase